MNTVRPTIPSRAEKAEVQTPYKDALKRLERLSIFLDEYFVLPGTSIKIGMDSIIGLIPGVGDLGSAALSGYLIWEGLRLGVPRAIIMKMAGNLLLDTVGGVIPVLGDLFDLHFKANRKNFLLIQNYLQQKPHLMPRTSQESLHTLGVSAVVIAALTLIGVGTLIFLFLRLLF